MAIYYGIRCISKCEGLAEFYFFDAFHKTTGELIVDILTSEIILTKFSIANGHLPDNFSYAA